MATMCSICKKECGSVMKLAFHVARDYHKIPVEAYYLKYVGSVGKCTVCSNPTKFLNLGRGYALTCSHKCGGIAARQRLTADVAKNESFKLSVARAQTKVWADRSTDEIAAIRLKARASQRATLNAMSDEERIAKFSHVKAEWTKFQRVDQTLPMLNDSLQKRVKRNVCKMLGIENGSP